MLLESVSSHCRAGKQGPRLLLPQISVPDHTDTVTPYLEIAATQSPPPAPRNIEEALTCKSGPAAKPLWNMRAAIKPTGREGGLCARCPATAAVHYQLP